MSEAELSVAEFNRFRELIYKEFGISLSDKKRTLVKARLRKWLKEFNLQTYDELYVRLTGKHNHEELILLANAITTNVTSFFREEQQWIYLREHLKSHINYDTKSVEFGLYSNINCKIANIGKILLNAIINFNLNKLKVEKLKLEVFSDNKKAINLYQKFNFKETKTKEINGKKVICMELHTKIKENIIK